MKKISDKVVTDNGYRKVHECIYELRWWKNANFLIYGNSWEANAVSVLARTKEGDFILIDEYRVWPEKIVRSCILGGHESWQTMETSARHELEEEIGGIGWELYLVGKTIFSPYMFGYSHMFLANNIIYSQHQKLELWEEITPVVLSQNELELQIFSWKIECSTTISLYFLAKEKTKNFTCFEF